jgi:hypothetical protein
MEAPILVATRGGSTMLARIGVLQALKRHHVREFNRRQRERHCGRRKLARDRRPCPRSGRGRQISHIRRRWGSSALTGFWFQARVMRAGLSVRASSSLSEKACWVISLALTAAYRFRSFPVSRPFQNRSTCLKGAKDRDRGEPLGSAPPTPPYVRVRIRRFERLR